MIAMADKEPKAKIKRGRGRPKLDIDPKKVLELAKIQCTYEEMAAVFDCSTDTLKRNFADLIGKGREEGKMSLRRAQHKAAIQGASVPMMIWLGKQHLGQKDKRDVTTDGQAMKGYVGFNPEDV
jgi:hypothetical protein